MERFEIDSYAFDFSPFQAILSWLSRLPSQTLTVEWRMGVTWNKDLELYNGLIVGKDSNGDVICVPFTNAYISIHDDPIFYLIDNDTVWYLNKNYEIYWEIKEIISPKEAGIQYLMKEDNFGYAPVIIFKK